MFKMRALPGNSRNHLTAFLSELAGTFLFLLFAFAIAQTALTPPTPADDLPNLMKIFFISLGFGCSLTVNVWLFYRVSGGMFNPAVTLALLLVGAVPPYRCLIIFPAQIIGAIAAAATVSGLLPGPLDVGVRLGGDASATRGLFIEMFTTCQLCFTVIMLAVVKHKATFLAPVGIGLAVFIGHMLSINYTGAGLNPARALAPDVINGSFPGYHWIYWLGPVLGALLSAGFYHLLEALDWHQANPGQDYDDLETQIFKPGSKVSSRPNVAALALTQSHAKVGENDGRERTMSTASTAKLEA